MRKLCFFDFEASSADAATARAIEAATATFSDDGRLLQSQSSVFKVEEFLDVEITEITGLRNEHCSTGKDFSELRQFLETGFGDKETILVGHNILNYDCEIVKRLDSGEKLLEGRVLVDTMVDLPFPKRTTSRKLTHLCSDRGIVTPNAHGALYDCIYTAQLLFSYTKEEFEQILERAKSPLVYIQAGVDYNTKDLAKKHKFRFNAKDKVWFRAVRLFDREQIKKEIGNDFKVSILPPEWEPAE